ncbi:MAG: hypothetical protein ACI8WB_003092 [Phenylobacterium sp.]|jgi:hypothetical protein
MKKLLSAIAVIATLAASTYAMAGYPLYVTIYYSDASKTTIVGDVEQICGGTISSGYTTAYKRTMQHGYCHTGGGNQN